MLAGSLSRRGDKVTRQSIKLGTFSGKTLGVCDLGEGPVIQLWRSRGSLGGSDV